MSVKNFKIGTGLDLEGLILTTANSELLVNGSALATQTYVDNAVNGVTVDPSGWAGGYIDWNPDTLQFDVNATSVVNDTAGAIRYNLIGSMAGPTQSSYLQAVTGTSNIDVNIGALVTELTTNQLFALTTQLPTQYTDSDAVNAIANAIPVGSGITYTVGVGFDVNTNYIATKTYAESAGISAVQNAAGYGLTYDINQTSANLSVDTSVIATQSYVTGLGYITSSQIPDNYITSVSTDFEVVSGTLSLGQFTGIATKTYVDNLIQDGLAPSTTSVWSAYKTSTEISNAISNLVGLAPTTLDTLQELAAAFDNQPDTLTNLVTTVGNKQDALTASTGINLNAGLISVDLAGIAGTGISVVNNQLTAAPAYISSVDASFAVSGSGQLSLSDNITIASVELTDSVASVTAASDVFGNASMSTYAMGSGVTVGTLPTGADVADVFITIKADVDTFIVSRTSKLTYVNTGGDAPTWTEYGIINSGNFPATTISFDSSGNIIANVTGSGTYSAKGVVTVLK